MPGVKPFLPTTTPQTRMGVLGNNSWRRIHCARLLSLVMTRAHCHRLSCQVAHQTSKLHRHVRRTFNLLLQNIVSYYCEFCLCRHIYFHSSSRQTLVATARKLQSNTWSSSPRCSKLETRLKLHAQLKLGGQGSLQFSASPDSCMSTSWMVVGPRICHSSSQLARIMS